MVSSEIKGVCTRETGSCPKRIFSQAYRNLLLDGVVVKSKELIEKMRAKQKAHRNILDKEPGFLHKL